MHRVPEPHEVLLVYNMLAELREQYEAATADLRAHLKARVEKINELMESAAHNAADLEEMKHELEAVSTALLPGL